MTSLHDTTVLVTTFWNKSWKPVIVQAFFFDYRPWRTMWQESKNTQMRICDMALQWGDVCRLPCTQPDICHPDQQSRQVGWKRDPQFASRHPTWSSYSTADWSDPSKRGSQGRWGFPEGSSQRIVKHVECSFEWSISFPLLPREIELELVAASKYLTNVALWGLSDWR